MALPISIGDAIEICKSIVAVYKFCRHAPLEMKHAVEKADYVATILESIQSSEKQLSYLSSTNGERLNRLLKSEVSSLQKSLKRLKQLVLKWKKAWPRLGKRVMFLTFALPEVPDLRNDLDARMTGIDRILNLANLAGGGVSPNQLNALAAALRQHNLPSKQSIKKGDPERKAVKEALRASGIEGGRAARLDSPKKADLLKTLSDHGVSQARSELVTQLYESESGRADIPESPTPPNAARNARPEREDRSPARKQVSPTGEPAPPKHQDNKSFCEILVVDSYNGHRSLITHAYLEYYRAWVANNAGGWLFHRVCSAGLKIETSFRTSEAGKLDTDPEYLTQPGRVPDQYVIDTIIGEEYFFKTDDRPYEKASIVERIQAWHARGLSSGFSSRYDYILTFEPAMVAALEQLQRQNSSLNSERVGGDSTKSARIILLPGITATLETVPKDYVLPIGKAVAHFLTTELGFQAPVHSIKGGGLRTSYMQVSRPAQMTRVEKGLAEVERRSGCKLHLAAESVSYGWVVAIVGKKEKLGAAEEMVRLLRSFDTLLPA